MKIAVAGGSGFVGRHVVSALRDAGHDALVLGRRSRGWADGATFVRWDGAGLGPAPDLAGCHAVVNLVGIKRETGPQTFEAVHVEATRRLIAAARRAGLRRFVQVSVVCSRPDARSPYHDTKWRAEELARGSGLEVTILRPGVIFGPGDDMVTHLVKMVRFAPLFPIVGTGRALLQPVDVRDVAQAVRASLEHPAAIGRTYDIVGSRRLTLKEVVRTVAQGLRLRLWIVPVPVAVQRPAVRALNAISAQPLSTPAQLQMLVDGLVGDPGPARDDLGLLPRPFEAARVETLAAAIPPLFGFSLRLVHGPAAQEWLLRRRGSAWRAPALAIGGTLLVAALSRLVPNLWLRLAAAYAVLIPVSLAFAGASWKELCRPAARHLAQALVAAVVLYLATGITLALVPALAGAVTSVVAWKAAVPAALVPPLLLFIILGEEVVWRGAVTLPLAARLGPWPGVLLGALAFGAAHVPLGLPVVVVAAVALGGAWGALAVKTRSLVPAFLCHLLWDLAVLVRVPGLG